MTETNAGEVRSYCRICAAACGIVVQVDGNRVLQVRGDAQHPESAGYTCPKGRALPQLHHHPERLDAPRIGTQTSSWPTVLDDLAARLARVVDEHGPHAVGAYFGTGLAYDTAGWAAANAWLAAIGSRRLFTPATVDNAPVLAAAEIVAGHPQANPVCDFERARLVLVVGSNPIVSHGYGTAMPDPVRRLRAVQAHGGRVWVLDPLRTETAAAADGHLMVRPGSDAVTLAWLLSERLAAGLSHHATAVTEPQARDRLADAVHPFTLDRVRDATGVDVEQLVALRDAVIAADGALALWCGTGVTMGRDGLVAELLRWALLALSSSLDTADGMHFHRGTLLAIRRLRSATAADADTAPTAPAGRPELRHWLGQDPCVALVDEIEAGAVRALVVAGANPITAFPQPDATRRALARLDTLGVADVTDNELTRAATHVLAVAGQLERADVPMQEQVLAHAGSRFTPAVVAVAPERRPAWWVFAQLAHRMTGRDLFGHSADELTDTDVLALVARRNRDDFDAALAAGPHGVRKPTEIGWVRDELRDGAPWAIAPDVLLARLAELDTRSQGRPNEARPGELRLVPRRRMRANNSVSDPVDPEREPLIVIHPDDAREAGVTNGDTVVVTSAHGHTSGVARVDDKVRAGVVSMSHGDAACSPGALVSAHDEIDELTGMPIASGVSVRLSGAMRASRSTPVSPT